MFDMNAVNSGIIEESKLVCEHASTFAEQVGADLVVVENHGMSGVRRFVLGSVPNKVSHHCPCSLLIVDTSRE
jgi:nucleotide-binding universal stress UspA family protein